MNTSALEKLGIQLPIIQAPMAGVSNPNLAATVSNNGALGSLGLGTCGAAQALSDIKETKQLTDKPFNVNLFCHAKAQHDTNRENKWLQFLDPFFKEFDADTPKKLGDTAPSFIDDPDMLDVIIEQRPSIVSLHFGLPNKNIIKQLKDLNIILMASATNLNEAKAIEDAGLDFIIAQGWEAGGHRGIFNPNGYDTKLSTFALLSLLKQKCNLPIIAAGGIMNGAGISAALKMGACAAQMGTAFVSCAESSANQAYRDALLSEKALTTNFTTAISGRPARGIINRTHLEVDVDNRPDLPDYPICYLATKALDAAARSKNNFDFAPQWAGQGAGLSRAMPAAELINTLAAEI